MEKLKTSDPDQERQEALAYCERTWPEWVDAKAKMDRAGGNSADANRDFNDINRVMDHCLEDLFRQTVVMVEG